MGFFDDAVNESVPGGDLAKPLLIAAGALLLGHLFSKHDDAPAADAPASGGGLLGGLGGALSGAFGGSSVSGGAPAAQGQSGGGFLGNLGGLVGGVANSPLGGLLAGSAAGAAVSGGLDSLLNQFRTAGHGAAVDSWVGNGDNHPISPDQINSVLGNSKIAEIAQQAGLSPDQLSQLLAQALPSLISKLAPGGQVQQG
jgi:uncharacterized protein YidB (DUF937 family)